MNHNCKSSQWIPIPLWGWSLLALCWFSIGTFRPLLEPDEGRYAEIPREMWVSGDWVTPRLNGLKYFEKPPLQYWATAAAYNAFGLHEWTSRWFALTTTFLCFPLVYFAAAGLSRSTDVGLAALLGLAVNPVFVGIGQMNILDGAFTLFTVSALLSLIHAIRTPRGSRGEHGWVLLMWASMAAAVLTKGVAAPVLAIGTLVIYSVATDEWSVWHRLHWLPGLSVFAAITMPWFVVVTHRNDDFLQFFFVHEHLRRFLTTVHQRVGPWWYFLPLLAISLLPWARQLPAAWRELYILGADTETRFTARVLAAWCLVVTFFYSMSHSKLMPYVMPVLPVLAMLLAPQLAAHRGMMRTAASWSAGLLALVALVAVGLVGHRWHLGETPSNTMAVALTLVLGCAAIAAAAARYSVRRPSIAAIAVVAASLLGWSATLLAYSSIRPADSTKPMMAAIRAQLGPQTQLYSVGHYRESLSAYLGRTVQLVGYRGEMDFGLERESAQVVVTPEHFLALWPLQADALAFVEPAWLATHPELLRTGHIVVTDGRTVVVKRP